jgi:hypothetical protein
MNQIRKSVVIVVMLIAALIVISATTVFAQSDGYVLNWFSVNSGGQSAGGGYTLSGISGQAEAGGLSGDGYALSGGFWQPKDQHVYLPIVLR